LYVDLLITRVEKISFEVVSHSINNRLLGLRILKNRCKSRFIKFYQDIRFYSDRTVHIGRIIDCERSAAHTDTEDNKKIKTERYHGGYYMVERGF